jgi:hypothetical protein
MSWLDNLAWLAMQRWLESYCRRNKSIQHCFIRHSTALAAQNLWVSDYDLAFFVDANNFHEVENHAARIRRDLRKAFVLDAIVLPASPMAYHLCASHYPHRSLYPMNRWRLVHGPLIIVSDVASGPLPLDHCPEGFLYGYLTPVLLGQKRPHPAKATLMRRKLEREFIQITGSAPRACPSKLYDVVAEDIRLWDEFYRKLSFPSTDRAVEVWPTRNQAHLAFTSRWAGADVARSEPREVDSVWLYPSFHNDHKPYLVLNLEPSVSQDDCQAAVTGLLKTFRGLDFHLLLGTRRSMIGRLSGLSRVTLLEPWLCKAFGHCLYGDGNAAHEIHEPATQELKEKIREYFLYLSYRVFPGRPFPYSLYRLCFTLDHLLRHRELVMDGEDLADIYGQDFARETHLEGRKGRQSVLDAWKVLHGLDLFELVP